MLLSMFEVNKKDQDHTLKNIPNLSENTSQLNLIWLIQVKILSMEEEILLQKSLQWILT